MLTFDEISQLIKPHLTKCLHLIHSVTTVTSVLVRTCNMFLISSIDDGPGPRIPCRQCSHGMCTWPYTTKACISFGPLPFLAISCNDFLRGNFCSDSLRDIPTVVLPNRLADIETGDSGAASVWAGPRGGAAARPRPSTAGLRYLSLYLSSHFPYIL